MLGKTILSALLAFLCGEFQTILKQLYYQMETTRDEEDKTIRVSHAGERDGMPTATMNGKSVSRIVYGTLRLHTMDDPNALLDLVYASGCNAFDVAAIYGGGKCEEVLG